MYASIHYFKNSNQEFGDSDSEGKLTHGQRTWTHFHYTILSIVILILNGKKICF